MIYIFLYFVLGVVTAALALRKYRKYLASYSDAELVGITLTIIFLWWAALITYIVASVSNSIITLIKLLVREK